MKIESLLKSALIIVLLVGVTDAKAAAAIKNKVGRETHCPVITIKNISSPPTYDLHVGYFPCEEGRDFPAQLEIKPNKPLVIAVKPGSEPPSDLTFCRNAPCFKGSKGEIKSIIPEGDMEINCGGTSDNPSCR